MTQLKVALVSEHASPLSVLGEVDAGGQNVHVAALAGALADRGHEVTVYTRRDQRSLPTEVPLRDGVIVHHVPAGPPQRIPKDELLPYMGEFGIYLERYWSQDPPELVHSHFWMSGLAALRGTRDLGVPVVHTYHALGTVKRRHQGAADTSPTNRISLETAVGHACHRIIATCRDEVRELHAMGIPAEHVRVVPCGVDVNRFVPDGVEAERHRWPRLLQVGRLVPRKGTDLAVTALARIPTAELLVAGGPPLARLAGDPEARRLTKLAAEAGVGDRVVMLGGVPREDMPALLRSADLVLCPSVYEPFGITPLEAMACAVPVVASAVGGHLDTVAHGTTGRLVTPASVIELANSARELLGSARLRAAYGAAGRRRVLRRFSWDRVAAETERVYDEALVTAPREQAVRAQATDSGTAR
ncbi:glycosyltransferase [Streptomyces sp. NPDC001020]